MADPINRLMQPELRQWEPAWYERVPHAVTDWWYGPNAGPQQGANVNKLFGTENPFNVPAQAQEAGNTLGRGLKFGDAATAGVGALGAGFAMLGVPGRRMKPHFGPPDAGGSMPAPVAQEAKGITAYHGSPHDFDRFDLSKIGTGEGAQAYGHGLYFAENPTVAEEYRVILSGASPRHRINGEDAPKSIRGFGQDGDRMSVVMDNVANFEKVVSDRLSSLQKLRASSPRSQRPQIDAAIADANSAILDAAEARRSFSSYNPNDVVTFSREGGKTYEVRINANADDFLDWDKPLSQQSEKVRQSAQQALGYRPDVLRGDEFMRAVELERGGNSATGQVDRSAATKALREAGIPGIRYLDQGSRTSGEGSRNYVVFDDKMIEILRKYGLAGLIGAGGAAAGGQDSSAQPVNRLLQGAQ